MNPAPDIADRLVGDLVAEDFRRARIFKKYGIEFCCGGGIPLRQACDRLGVDADEVAEAIADSARDPNGPLARVQSWSPSFLVDYIESVHHAFVRESIPALRAFTTKVARVHGDAQPELPEIAGLFADLADEMEAHLAFEEEELFPLIRAGAYEQALDAVGRAEEEHVVAGSIMERIRQLTADFTPPDWACATYRASFVNLKEFQNDLHVHVHLENNVLFRKLEKAEA